MKEIKSFYELNISENIKKAIYELNLSEPTPIQKKALFPALLGLDILAQAPTGTGKTFAYGIPLINSIDPFLKSVQGIVICPTRELSIQVANEIRSLLKYEDNINVLAVFGGENIERQITFLKRDMPQIIVATPGRFNDHIKRKKISLNCVKALVLDEADEMLSMGFLEDIEIILKNTPKSSSKLLFSATMPDEILEIAEKFQKENTFKIKIEAPKKEEALKITQYYLEMKNSIKADVLKSFLDNYDYKLCLVFCNTKKRVDELYEILDASGYSVEALHGDMKQQNRDRVMYKFRNDKIRILIATDVAARGVDVYGIDAVFNYDAPLNPETYVHRIGRTGRADKTGVAYTFLSNREMFRLHDIISYTKTNILPLKRPALNGYDIKKADDFLNKACEIVSSEDLSQYIKKLKEYEEKGHDMVSLAASLLYMNIIPNKASKTKDISAGDISNEAKVNKKSPKSQKSRKNSKKDENTEARIFFNVGSLDKVHKRHITELINDHPQLFGIRASDIDIFDKFSFVSAKKKDALDICDALNGMLFKGRELIVEIAQEKKIEPNKKEKNLQQKNSVKTFKKRK